MARFMTRVVLHDDATWRDYDQLHREMESRGFSRQIRGDDARWYHLPHAEYLEGQSTVIEVRDRARAAATATGKRHSVLTVEYTAAAWWNLDAIS